MEPIPPPVPPVLPPKPGSLQILAIFTLVSGILNGLAAVGWAIGVIVGGALTFGLGCLLLPIPVYLGITAALEIGYALKLLPDPIRVERPNKTVAVLEIICILGWNLVSTACGIVALVLYEQEDVKRYFEARRASLPA